MSHFFRLAGCAAARACALSSCVIALVLGQDSAQAQIQISEERQRELAFAEAYGYLLDIDLVALRREVAEWSNAYAGPTAERAAQHATTVHGIIDRLTVLKRDLQKDIKSAQPAQLTHELDRLHDVWPAWLMADFNPPSAVRTILVRDMDQLLDALEVVQPGDEIILADGIWRGFNLDGIVPPNGSGARPIVIRAKNPGKAIIATEFAASFGRNLILRDLTFCGLGAHPGGQPGTFAPYLTVSGKNVRVSHCLFYAGQRGSGIVCNTKGLRFDQNYIAGDFAGSAVRINGRKCKLDGNYFGWQSNREGHLSAAIEVLAGAEKTNLASNFFSGPGASVLDAGLATAIEDNTFTNIPDIGLTISPKSRKGIVRDNMAFDVGRIVLQSSDTQFSNNYMEQVGLETLAVGISNNNTLIVSEQGPQNQPPQVDAGLLPGPNNLICTENEIIFPTKIRPVDNSGNAYDSEEDSNPVQLMRDVLGYLRPHQKFGRLGFQGEALPLGRNSEVGPTWLPAELSINRPLASSYDLTTSEIAVSAGSSDQSAADSFLSVEGGSGNEDVQSPAANVRGWTLQGWVNNRNKSATSGPIAQAQDGGNYWELRLTDDHRLVLSGETDGATWSFSTEAEYVSETGKSYFAIVVQPRSSGCDVCFYRGSETESVDLIAAELAPEGAFVGTAGFELGLPDSHELLSARLFSLPQGQSLENGFALLNSSDLEALRQGDLLSQ